MKKKKVEWKPVDPEEVKEMQEKIKSGKIKIECAPQDKLEDLSSIAYDLVDNILDYPGAFITDLSMISDFTGGDEEEEEMFLEGVRLKYGVDVSSVLHEYIVDIAEYIRETMREEFEKRETS